jgi:hypothetical protein
MRIDVHAHYWTGDYLDLLTGLGQAVPAHGRILLSSAFSALSDT